MEIPAENVRKRIILIIKSSVSVPCYTKIVYDKRKMHAIQIELNWIFIRIFSLESKIFDQYMIYSTLKWNCIGCIHTQFVWQCFQSKQNVSIWISWRDMEYQKKLRFKYKERAIRWCAAYFLHHHKHTILMLYAIVCTTMRCTVLTVTFFHSFPSFSALLLCHFQINWYFDQQNSFKSEG